MCIEFLSGQRNPMEDIAQAMFDYLSGSEPTEDGLKDYLADEKEKGRITRCGCGDPFFKVTPTDDGYKVIMSSFGNSGVYITTITKEGYSFESGDLSDIIEGYDEIQYNEYTE